MRRVAIIVLPLMASGCGGPIELTVLSFASDGLSYLFSGKSTTDHAISALAEEDCALFRPLAGKRICQPYAANEEPSPPVVLALRDIPQEAIPAAAKISIASHGGQSASLLQKSVVSEVKPIDVASARPTSKPMKLGVTNYHTSSLSENDIFLVLDSGPDFTRVSAFQARHAGVNAKVVKSKVGGAPFYKLVTGPYQLGDLSAARKQLAANGIKNSWAMRPRGETR